MRGEMERGEVERSEMERGEVERSEMERGEVENEDEPILITAVADGFTNR
ncbi:hypothetical protein ACFPM1_01245 [Halorubrum rubrum]|uniref:Uncharacterized protein n=1 Tax=Halorubrum rubrum TaxID=1126240 RepID=A0ABD5QXP1_9EURY